MKRYFVIRDRKGEVTDAYTREEVHPDIWNRYANLLIYREEKEKWLIEEDIEDVGLSDEDVEDLVVEDDGN